MRGMIPLVVVCLLFLGLALPGCTAEVEQRFTLIISSTTGGSVTTPGEGKFAYEAGAVVNLVAKAQEGYRFVRWTGDVDTIADIGSASTTITMDADRAIVATFAEVPAVRYSLSISSTRGGSVTRPGEGTFMYNAGTVVELVAEAKKGYRFVAWTGDVSSVENIHAPHTRITVNGNYSIRASFQTKPVPMVAAGCWHTLGLKSDGTVVATGYNEYGQCEVVNWTDIVQVVAGRRHTVGLRSDGTVVALGFNEYGQCNVGDWSQIVQVAAGANSWHTVGLKSDGTVVAVGGNWAGQCNVAGWRGIVQVAAGGHHTVGLKRDGTVVAVGQNNYGECDVSGWRDIVQVAAGCRITVGLKSDGTVVAAGWNDYGQCDVWGWTGIVHVAAGMAHTIGLRLDGTVVATGANFNGQCNVGDWMLT